FIAPGSEKSAKLAGLLDDSLVEVEGGFRLKWAEPHRPWIISWDAWSRPVRAPVNTCLVR
ncbi:MAG: hypothetical protein QF357_11695, partial [Dehalococcoidia bacterium]|nr:hypothetical protein [Dehalococcoidia bacterium]